MELLIISERNKLSLSDRNIYDFMVGFYQYYVTYWCGYTTELLDEYIYFMNEKYSMYKDKIGECFYKLYIDEVSDYHVPNFVSLIKNSTERDKEIVIEFYSQIIDAVEEFLGTQYYCGVGLSDREKSKFGKQFGRYLARSINWCPCKKTIIFFSSEDEFDMDDFEEYSLKGTKTIATHKHFGIKFRRRVCFRDLGKILNCCAATFFKINWNKSDSSELVLRPVY